MELTKEECKFILESILATPVQTTVRGLMSNVKLDDMVINLIAKFQAELKEESAQVSEK